MTGINATKTIRNLQFVNSFYLSNERTENQRNSGNPIFGIYFSFCFLKLGPVQTGRPPPGRGAGWESESLRVFNTRQESGNGTPKLRTGSRSVLQYGTRIRDWVPVRLAIRSPFIVIYLSGLLGAIQRVGALCFW